MDFHSIFSRVETKRDLKLNYMNKINYLTKEKYMLLVKKYEGGHWTPDSIDQRWEYHSRVIELAKSLNISDPGSVLEMGTMGISCVDDSDTIDYLERWDFPGKKPTYTHDSRIMPWPIKDKQYELFIALRVFQHLTPSQKEATQEAMRIARKVIIVVPDIYKNKVIPDSKGITYSDFVDFLGGIHPNLYFSTRDEYVYYWDVENPSKLNIEDVMRRTYFGGRQDLIQEEQEKQKKSFVFEGMRKVKKMVGRALNKIRKIVNLRLKEGAADRNESFSKNANRHIEFIGPAGVGKTTICDEVKKYMVGDWNYKENLLDIMIKYNEGKLDENLYLRLLCNKVKHLENYDLSSYQKIRLIEFFSDVLLKDLAIHSSDLSSKRFFLDEGLCHNFSEELIDLTDSDLKILMTGRAFVFLQARNSAAVVNQIRKRERETGQIAAYHVRLGDNALRDHTEKTSLFISAFVDRVEALGLPVCKIFIEDDFQTNVKHVLDFENRLIQAA